MRLTKSCERWYLSIWIFKLSFRNLWLSLELTVAIMDFKQQSTSLPMLGMKYKLKLVTNVPANISMSIQRCFQVDMTSRRRTTSNQRWNNVMHVSIEIYNVEQRRNTLCFSTLNWTTLDNIETTLSFSTSILKTLGNVETTLQIWPFCKMSVGF